MRHKHKAHQTPAFFYFCMFVNMFGMNEGEWFSSAVSQELFLFMGFKTKSHSSVNSCLVACCDNALYISAIVGNRKDISVNTE